MKNEDIDFEDEEKDDEDDDDNFDINEDNIVLECCFDNIKDETDLLIGFDPDAVLNNREEFKINLIYFDSQFTKENKSYDYYKKFKINVVGGFYASDEIDIFKKYLEEINKLKKVPPYVVVTYEKNFDDIYNACLKYTFIKEIIMIDRFKKSEKYLISHKKLLKHISKGYDDLIDYLKKMGDMTSNWNSVLRFFSSSRIFTSNEIQMNRQLSTCPIISAYEYDQLYYLVHRAYAHFFTNDSGRKNPKYEKWPTFDDLNFKKLKEFLNDLDSDTPEIKKKLLEEFTKLNKSKRFTEDAITAYTGETFFCYLLNRVMRNFEKGLIKLAYYFGPFLFGLNKYALEHPEKCINEDTVLYRKIRVNPLDKYAYKLSVGHIICFPSITSTSIMDNKFNPTKLSMNINANPFKNKTEETKKSDMIDIDMIIHYKHSEGNITPGLDIQNLSKSKCENERILLPFTFLRLNSISEKPDKDKGYIFDMQIINRKKIIEYDLKEGKKYNIEELEDSYDENKPMFIEDLKEETFKVKEKEEEKKSKCNIY
jgi:hypothetical protein